jgi:hypothetical protein
MAGEEKYARMLTRCCSSSIAVTLATVDILAVLQDREADPAAQDAILYALVRSYRRTRDDYACALLHLALWPGLRSLGKKAPAASWEEILSAFAQVIEEKYPLRRRQKVAANLKSETLNRLAALGQTDKVQHNTARRLAQQVSHGVDLGELLGADDPSDLDRKTAERMLEVCVAAGAIEPEHRDAILDKLFKKRAETPLSPAQRQRRHRLQVDGGERLRSYFRRPKQ